MMTLKIAFRNILRNRRRSAMTLLAVAVGAMGVVLFGEFVRFVTAGLETNAVEKVISDQASRLETAVSELNKLQSKSLEQVSALVESATRAAKEQIAFAEQIGGEWRKLVLAATKSATELFVPKA